MIFRDILNSYDTVLYYNCHFYAGGTRFINKKFPLLFYIFKLQARCSECSLTIQ